MSIKLLSMILICVTLIFGAVTACSRSELNSIPGITPTISETELPYTVSATNTSLVQLQTIMPLPTFTVTATDNHRMEFSEEKITPENVNSLSMIMELDILPMVPKGLFWFLDGNQLGIFDASTLQIWEPKNFTKVQEFSMPMTTFFEKYLENTAKAMTLPLFPIKQSHQLLAFVTQEKTLNLWDPLENKIIHTYEWSGNYLEAVSFSPSGKWFAWAGQSSGEGQALRRVELINISDGTVLQTFQGYHNDICNMEVSPDSEMVAISTCGRNIQNNEIIIWRINSGAQISITPNDDQIQYDHRNIRFDHQGNLLAIIDANIYIWDINQNLLLRRLDGEIDPHSVFFAEFSPDDRLFAVVAGIQDHMVGFFDVATGNLLFSTNREYEDIVYGTFSPDGKIFATLSKNGSVQLWGIK